ncbi:3-hydroxyacyl-CoA dehydrogenase NAD-binding domain-containing protein [Streptomyces sp. NPDC005951]|uniref:3-hydroxyacyl-CoA dehydrogenase NAD-binding domain-containing protein n=1 Tax=Streptomyces sp. NPDC005951 TaxID=3154573 RepID=UPI0033CF6965
MSAAIARVGVVGGGQMGAGIAEVCARARLDTIVCEADRAAADRARERVAVSLERAVQRGKLDRLSAEDALGRLTFPGGLDTVASVAASLYDEFKEPLYAPPPLLQRMVEAGLFGRNTGRGFHRYDRG